MSTPSEGRRTVLYWVRAWLPVVIAIAVIAVESTELFGADHTSNPLRWLYEHLAGPVSDDSWSEIHHIIRKCGHFVGYGLVGLAWLRAWWMTLPNSRFLQDALLAVLGTAMVASSDEIHQTFLPNRTGMAQDVLLDCCGAIVTLIAVFVISRIRSGSRFERSV